MAGDPRYDLVPKVRSAARIVENTYRYAARPAAPYREPEPGENLKPEWLRRVLWGPGPQVPRTPTEITRPGATTPRRVRACHSGSEGALGVLVARRGTTRAGRGRQEAQFVALGIPPGSGTARGSQATTLRMNRVTPSPMLT
jgi:hypothetical protein